MNIRAQKTAIAAIALLSLIAAIPSRAQTPRVTLSGKVTDLSGRAVPGAKIAIKNVATVEVATSQSNSAGAYSISNLAPGDYEVTVAAPGFDTKVSNVTLTGGINQTLNVALSPALSLQSLGFPAAETQSNPREQALLDKRSHMLKIHQELGLITTIPLAATVISGFFSGGKNVTSSSARDLHVALGSVTAGLYITTAYYAIFSPKIHGTKTEGPIRWHKALAWIHGPGMILTPVLGAMAFNERSKGERVTGIAHYHGQVAIVTAAAYGLAIIPVTVRSGIARKTARTALSFFGFHHFHSTGPTYMLETDREAEKLARTHEGE